MMKRYSSSIRFYLIGLLVFINANVLQAQSSVNCKNEKGNDVPWFLAYKLPPMESSTDLKFKVGSGYFYLLPGSQNWIQSSKQINESDSILGVTLHPLLTKNPNLAYILYNDQPPYENPMIRGGHTKGLVVSKSNGGFWLIHSVPHFPLFNDTSTTYGYPEGGLINGQIFFCLSIPVSQVDNVGEILQYTKPDLYAWNIPKGDVGTKFPKLAAAVNKKSVNSPPWYKQMAFSSEQYNFKVFVKGPKFHREIFSDWIAPIFNTSLNVQSWLSGNHAFDSNCTSANEKVYNVISTKIGSYNFSSIVDHSKWGVGISKPIVCIADLNRTKAQKRRGGVALCMTNKDLWKAFKSMIQNVEPCNATTHRHPKTKKSHHHQILTNEIY